MLLAFREKEILNLSILFKLSKVILTIEVKWENLINYILNDQVICDKFSKMCPSTFGRLEFFLYFELH